MKHTIVGVDLAKQVIQVCVVSATSEACRFFLGERPRREKSKEWIS